MIFFTDDIIKRIIASENLLIDATFIYPKLFYQTLIIMFYDLFILKCFQEYTQLWITNTIRVI